jgi:hypothetical protein
MVVRDLFGLRLVGMALASEARISVVRDHEAEPRLFRRGLTARQHPLKVYDLRSNRSDGAKSKRVWSNAKAQSCQD